MGSIKNLHIAVGLPGSGKTTLLSKMYDEDKANNSRNIFGGKKSTLIECDNYLRGDRPRYKSLEELIDKRNKTFQETTFFDALFLSKVDIEELILAIKKYVLDRPENIIVHYFEVDREACLKNDAYRKRYRDSSITINNAHVDSFDEIKSIAGEFDKINFEFKSYKVETEPDWKDFAQLHGLYVDSDGLVRGESWSLGGDWRDCWDRGGTVEADVQPDSMKELDELLEKVCPNITFLQYKSIMNDCVDTDEYYEHDYYGGSVQYARYVLNAELLYNLLKEKNLI